MALPALPVPPVPVLRILAHAASEQEPPPARPARSRRIQLDATGIAPTSQFNQLDNKMSSSTFSIDALTAEQARYILDCFVKNGRIELPEVEHLLTSMHDEIRELEQRLDLLRRAAGASAQPAIMTSTSALAAVPIQSMHGTNGRSLSDRGSAPRRARVAPSPETLASRKLQGQYLGLMRQFTPDDRSRYQQMARDDGRQAAVTAMRSALGK
jgi:hypothetical protein